MSLFTLIPIIDQARADSQAEMIDRFRQQLLADPEQTQPAFALSSDEAADFRARLAQRLAQLATDYDTDLRVD